MSVAGPPRPAPGRVAGLDGLRAIAATLILLHHAGYISGFTLDSSWGRFTGRADVGVPIFFVLSGFLLGTPVVRSILDAAPPPAAGPFLRRRAVRIYPAYLLALVTMLVIGGIAVDGADGFLWGATLLHVYSPDHAIAGIAQSWSLSAELAFYLLLVALGWAMTRSVARRSGSVRSSATALLGCCAAAYGGSLAFRWAVHHFDPTWATTSTVWFPALVDHFALGVSLAVLREWADRSPAVRTRITRVGRHTLAWWLVAVAAYVVVATQLDLSVNFEVASFEREVARQALYGVIGVAAVAPLALAPAAGGRGRSALDWPPLVFLGAVSYGVYLWHVFVLFRIMDWTGWEEFEAPFFPLAAGGLAGSILIAALSWRLLEQPLLRRFSSRHTRVASNAP